MSDQQTSNSSARDPMAAKTDTTIAYTDGACKGNPGAGGWGAHLIFSDGHTQDLYGGAANTTNNRMELMGAIKALQYSPLATTLEIWTDSSYVQKGITEWIEGWRRRGWKNASNKPIANPDLWQQLDALCQGRSVEWHWVKGHAGHLGNEKADELANLGVSAHYEPESVYQSANPQSKKKAPIARHNQLVLADDDWLKLDPLGLDEERYDTHDEDEDSAHDTYPTNDHHELITAMSAHDAAPTAADATLNSPLNTQNLHKNMTENMTIESNTATEVPLFDGDTSRANPHFQPLLPKPIAHPNRQLVMDTETTGLDPLKGDRIIEVGIVEMINRKLTGEKLHVYINPERGMDEVVIRIHGISEAFLADKPTFDKVAKDLYDFMDGAEIIAHNATFDMNFLNMEFDKVGLTDFTQRVTVTDSLILAKQQYPGQKNTLDALVRRLDVGKQDRTFHGALLDSEILAEVYLAMTGGQVALAIEDDVQSVGGQTSHADFATLATLLLTSTEDRSANQAWFEGLAEQYPEIKTNLALW